jgi:hypothetical protein
MGLKDVGIHRHRELTLAIFRDRIRAMHRTFMAGPIALLLLTMATVSEAVTARAYVSCENGQHLVSVSGWYLDSGYDTLYEAVVFKREAIGVCRPPELIPSEPIPIVLELLYGNNYTFEASVTFSVPESDVAYRYTPYGVLPDGSLESMYYNCDYDSRNYAIANCSDAPIARGRLEFTWECLSGWCAQVIPCGDDCWTEEIFVNLTGLPDARPYPVPFGEVVDVYGDRSNCSMPGGDPYSLTRLERAPQGACGPVAVQETNWGRVKARFR